MKKLILISTILSLTIFPVLAGSPTNNNKSVKVKSSVVVTENTSLNTDNKNAVTIKDNNAASSAVPVLLTTSNDTCMGSSGLGGQGMTFGFSVGSTWVDKNCVLLKQSRELKNQGHNVAAKMVLCMDSNMYKAFSFTNKPCPKELAPIKIQTVTHSDAE